MNANTINSKNVISGVNDLATKCPKISAMWSAKNTYTPSEVSVGSNKKAWFVCPDCKQEFEARVFHVARLFLVSMIWLPSALWPLPCGVTRTIALPVKYLQATTRRYGSYAPTASRNLRLLFAMSLNP